VKKTFQIIFTNASAAELAALPQPLQLEVLNRLEEIPEALFETNGTVAEPPEGFARLEREGRSLYRFRTGDHRLYFERTPGERAIVLHRILHKNSLRDFFFRSNIPGTEEEALQKNPDFWKMIDGSGGGDSK
jgi:mRNA-degrading endonuclease RelE of RelBE toxin-antitoxin system